MNITFLVRIQPIRDTFPADGTAEEFGLVGEHFERLKEATANGSVILCGRLLDSAPPPYGYILLRADSAEEATTWMEGDPAIRGGIFRLVDIRPFGIATFGSVQLD